MPLSLWVIRISRTLLCIIRTYNTLVPIEYHCDYVKLRAECYPEYYWDLSAPYNSYRSSFDIIYYHIIEEVLAHMVCATYNS